MIVQGAESLDEAARLLAQGELVAIPTESVYGLAADAFDADAVAKVFAAKERPTFDPLIVHVPESWGALDALAAHEVIDAAALRPAAGARAAALMALWPGPITLVLPRGPRIPDLVTAGLATVAVRVPRHPVTLALLDRLQRPLAAPSANRFGRVSPTSAADVEAELGARVGLILDGGRCEVGVESTVIAVEPAGGLVLLRPGGTPVEEIARVAGTSPRPAATEHAHEALAAPGMLASHYAPAKGLTLLPTPLQSVDLVAAIGDARPKSVGVLVQSGDARAWTSRLEAATRIPVRVEVLSPRRDLAEAARNLFAALRALDDSGAERLFAERCAESTGLGYAIQDRLTRAAA